LRLYALHPRSSIHTPEEQKALDTITERLIASYLSDIPDDKNIESFSKSMQADGSWTDIDYNDQPLFYLL